MVDDVARIPYRDERRALGTVSLSTSSPAHGLPACLFVCPCSGGRP